MYTLYFLAQKAEAEKHHDNLWSESLTGNPTEDNPLRSIIVKNLYRKASPAKSAPQQKRGIKRRAEDVSAISKAKNPNSSTTKKGKIDSCSSRSCPPLDAVNCRKTRSSAAALLQ
jgi:hypothetical protein